MSFDVTDILSIIIAIGVASSAIGAARLATYVGIRAWTWLQNSIADFKANYEDWRDNRLR